MSTLTYARPLSIAPSSIPAGYVEVPCSQCTNLVNVPARQSREVVTCTTCRRESAFNEACRLRNDVRALVKGDAPFDFLSLAERQEQLDLLFGSRHAPKALLPAGETRQIDYDTPIYVYDGDEPDAETRAWIESREEADELKANPDAFDPDFGESRPAAAFE